MSIINSAKTVSVIIPACNAAPWLPMLFDGLDRQIFRDFETIFIDDGSTDETGALLDAYAASRESVKVLHEPNTGVATARNKGVDTASGKYIVFIDADDAVSSSYLSDLFSLATSMDLDVGMCNGWRFRDKPGDMNDHPLVVRPKPEGVVSGADWLESSLNTGEWPSVIWMTIVRRDFLLRHNIRFMDGLHASSDLLWVATIQSKAQRVAYTPKQSYYYRCTPGSIINDNSTTGKVRRIQARTLVIEELWRMADIETLRMKGLLKLLAASMGRILLADVAGIGSFEQRIAVSAELRKRGFLCRLFHETKTITHRKRILMTYGFAWLEAFTDRGYIAKKIGRLISSEDQKRRLTPQKSLLYFALNIVDHCNLRCKGCDHFAPIAEERFVSLDCIEKDLAQMSRILKGDLFSIGIMGGEPLLHPQLKEILFYTRRAFPETIIRLVTNGILLLRQDEDFWRICREQNIFVVCTKYPINLDFEAMKEKAAAHHVLFDFHDNTGLVTKTSYKIPLDTHGRQNPRKSFSNCFHANLCPFLMEGKFYPCTVAPNVRHFNKKFGTHMALEDGDFLNIYHVTQASEVLDFLSSPKPFCRYCDVENRSYGQKWERSQKAMEEWIA